MTRPAGSAPIIPSIFSSLFLASLVHAPETCLQVSSTTEITNQKAERQREASRARFVLASISTVCMQPARSPDCKGPHETAGGRHRHGLDPHVAAATALTHAAAAVWPVLHKR
ncbi:unnamed protein product [Urochloa humidicola]